MINKRICTSITFYDVEKNSVDMKGLFTFCEEWMLKLAFKPLRGSIQGSSISMSKTKTFNYIKKILFENDNSNISNFWFAAYLDEWDYDMTDGLLSISVDLDKRGVINLYFDNSIVQFKRIYVTNLIREIAQYFKANYGIIYGRELAKGPGLYAFGIISGLETFSQSPEIQKERKNIGEWFRRYGFLDGGYVQGQLRDIYPMNLLSEVHLNQPVFNTTLKHWIETSPSHGELSPLTEVLWQWWVPEENINTVRESLRETGIIICI